jgi:hypothetical protein
MGGSVFIEAGKTAEGQPWTDVTLPNTLIWGDATYAFGRWIVGGHSTTLPRSTTIVTSMDLASWSAATISDARGSFAQFCSNGSVAIGIGSTFDSGFPSIFRTTSGTSWSRISPLAGVYTLISVACNGPVFIAARNPGDGGGLLRSTDDGASWTLDTSTSTITGLAYGVGRFIATTTSQTFYYSTDDGASWTLSSFPTNRAWNDISFNDGFFVITSRVLGVSDDHVAISTDGINWTESTISGDFNAGLGAHGGGVFVVTSTGSVSNAFRTSEDGLSWTGFPGSTNVTRAAWVRYLNELFIAGGGAGTQYIAKAP